MDIVKIAVLGIAGVFLAIPLKREKGEYSTFVAMVVGICIFIYLLAKWRLYCFLWIPSSLSFRSMADTSAGW